MSGWRRASKNRTPADILVMRLKELAPGATNITQFGCSQELNDRLRKELIKWAKKHTLYHGNRLETAVGMTLLDTAPVTIKGIKGNGIYLRGDADE